MNEVVALWVYLSSSPLFGLTATLLAYVLAQAVYQRLEQAPWANPVLWSVVALGAALWASKTPYPRYFAGAQFIHVLLGPAVVALGWPMWQRRVELRARWRVLLLAALVGGASAAAAAVGLAWAMGLPADVMASLAPKSVTAPVAMGIAEKLGGLPSLTAILVISTGILGAVLGPLILNILRIRDQATRGFALGVTSHGIGTARAFQESEQAGAFSGLAMGLNALATALLLPVLLRLFGII